MSAPVTTSRPALPLVILVLAAAWAVSSGITLSNQVEFLTDDYFPDGRYGIYFSGWVVAASLGVLGVVPAIAALRFSRATWLLLTMAVVSTLVDLAATIGLYVVDFGTLSLGSALRLSYLTPFGGDAGWKGVVSVLSFWIALPIAVLCLVRLLSRSSSAPAPGPTAAPSHAPADEWFVISSGASYGPYTWSQLMAYGDEGRITPTSLVRRGNEPVVPLGTLLRPGG